MRKRILIQYRTNSVSVTCSKKLAPSPRLGDMSDLLGLSKLQA